MLPENRLQILEAVEEGDLVLDVGGWASPFSRADWVIDLMPFETRGLYGAADPEPERFSEASWIERDICERTPWPFGDDQFDFAICSHTLEDVRDPIWVCAELNRVATAGYIEVPARAEEQTRGVHGPWVGWSHHHWLVDIEEGRIEFVLKPHLLHGRPEFCLNLEWTKGLSAAERVSYMFWERSFAYREKIFFEPDELHAYLRSEVVRAGPAAGVRGMPRNGPGLVRRALKRLS